MNLVGFLLKPELDSVVCILGDWVGVGGGKGAGGG